MTAGRSERDLTAFRGPAVGLDHPEAAEYIELDVDVTEDELELELGEDPELAE